jgi:hypothetical protein
VLPDPSDLQNEMLMMFHHASTLEVGFLVSLLVISFVLKQLVTVNTEDFGVMVGSLRILYS